MKRHERILSFLQIAALATAVLAVIQTGLGVVMWMGTWVSQHGMIGNVTFVVAAITAVLAWLWSRESGNIGLMMHAVGMAVLALIQVGLGEMDLRTLHIVTGFVFLVGALALVTLAYRKPGVVLDAAHPEEHLHEQE